MLRRNTPAMHSSESDRSLPGARKRFQGIIPLLVYHQSVCTTGRWSIWRRERQQDDLSWDRHTQPLRDRSLDPQGQAGSLLVRVLHPEGRRASAAEIQGMRSNDRRHCRLTAALPKGSTSDSSGAQRLLHHHRTRAALESHSQARQPSLILKSRAQRLRRHGSPSRGTRPLF